MRTLPDAHEEEHRLNGGWGHPSNGVEPLRRLSVVHGTDCVDLSGGDEEFAFAHDLFFPVGGLEPDVEAQSDDVDVSAGAPGSAGMFAVGIAEGDVDAGKFFVLQDVADDTGDADISADSEFAD